MLKLIESKGWKVMVHSYMCNDLSGWKQREVLILYDSFIDSNGTGPILWWRGVRSADPKSKDIEIHNSGIQPTHGATAEQEGPELRQYHNKA